jgi:dUTP pyrophosphatase
LKVRVKKIDGNAKELEYAHEGDSGMDLFANEDTLLEPFQRKLVGTGIKIAFEQGFEAQVRPKSGLAVKHGITVLNTPGTVDSSYRGEVKVILINLGNEPYKIERGKKIAQLVFCRVEKAVVEDVEELDETSRNDGGFGSTGLG